MEEEVEVELVGEEEEYRDPTRKPRIRKRGRPGDDYEEELNQSTAIRRTNAVILANTKPSYCLKKGIGSSSRNLQSLRSEHRKKLRNLLVNLMRQREFGEASGVLSVLLKGTVREKAVLKTRIKYTATLELLEYIKGDNISIRKIQNVYDLWVKKLGSLRNWGTEDRFAVQLEFILLCLKHGKTEEGYQAALCLMQERGFDSDPVSNLVVGLTFYQLWYSNIPKELQLQELDSSDSPVQSEGFEDRLYTSILNTEGYDAVESQEANSPLHCDSNTSIRNDKEMLGVDVNKQREVPMVLASTSYYDGSSMDHVDDVPYQSIFYTRGLPLWLLPLQLPSSNDNLADDLSRHRTLRNDHYNKAIKHLRHALYSNPPVLEAFHPLIQMLLLGDQVKEALDEVEKISPHSGTSFQLRLKAALLEHFDSGNCVKLSTIFQENMEKDPTCSYALGRLIHLHRTGEYSTEKLVEMIALHLDAAHANHDAWRELADCFMKLSLCEEDCMSVCFPGGKDSGKQKISNQISQIPIIFGSSESNKSWRLRCRWWLTLHFGQNKLASDIASGYWELLTYKAATACYLFGREFMYVVKARECLEEEPSNKNLSSILHMHVNSCTGFYFNAHK